MDNAAASKPHTQSLSSVKLSGQFSSSVQYSYAQNGSGSRPLETGRASAVQVEFNNKAEIFSSDQARHTLFNETARSQVDLSIRRSNALKAHQKQWEETIRKKLAARSLPEPTNDLGAIRNRDINEEYQSLLKAHRIQQNAIQRRFTSYIETTRQSGITLSDSFTRSSQRGKHEE